MDLVDEKGFKDLDTSEPASPESTDDDNNTEDDDYNDDDDDNNYDAEYPHVAKKVYRGKGVSWSISPESTESIIEAVKVDAKASNLSKLGASTHNSHTYVYRSAGCIYKQSAGCKAHSMDLLLHILVAFMSTVMK